ncbi:DUF2530 domain-containing protein [Nocardiopsis trehalosi]|uniref:DUF2530 domain-containing protein n=1 Tax=Nocardiopsis trehalosi TaxID=109329 RepID=UPI000834A4ED|nr:DUF2530 domain-containing protein [Nocardiopsis trehalosi]
MRTPRRPDPEVLEFDYRVPTALGTVAWTVALIVLLARGDRLPADERWWLGVCGVGIVLGVFAFFYIPRLLRKRTEAEAATAAGAPAAAPGEDGRAAPADRTPPAVAAEPDPAAHAAPAPDDPSPAREAP